MPLRIELTEKQKHLTQVIKIRNSLADHIRNEREEKLSEVIGYSTIESLIYKLFGLRRRNEQHDLEVSQFNMSPFIQFIGRLKKTFKDGLKHRCAEQKKIKHYFAHDDKDQSLRRLYSTYLGIIGEGKFYMRPIAGVLKFSYQNVNINKLENLMKRMCEKAGLEDSFTNQAEKRTCATSLYQSGLDEQMIMHRTGHRSINGVSNYKRERERESPKSN